ncbi:MAG: helicase-related protein [Chitinophagales bacterium]
MSTFISNNTGNSNIKFADRLQTLIGGSKELKFLVGYFYFSGLKALYESLRANKAMQLKILVGLEADLISSQLVELEHRHPQASNNEQFEQFTQSLRTALNHASFDTADFYEQLSFFKDMLQEGRLEIRKTLSANHAKLYVFHYNSYYAAFDNKKGKFITGSSNLTRSGLGLAQQEELNIEVGDFGFEEANGYFDMLWNKAIPLTATAEQRKKISLVLQNETQTAHITPFEAYAYILKTYIETHERHYTNSSLGRILADNNFREYSYQIDAVNQALNIIKAYNGIIIADVVGLGKSVIASLIAHQLNKRGLILCPPGLIGEEVNSSGWWEYKNKFHLHNWDIKSSGNVENIAKIVQQGYSDYEVVIIDEAHRFRTQDTASYEALADICRGKQVILLTATPFNNSPLDIFSLLKLFIIPGQSSITQSNDLESKFQRYHSDFKELSNILKFQSSKDGKKQTKVLRLYEKRFGEKGLINLHKVREQIKQLANAIKNDIMPVVIRRNRLDLKNDAQYGEEVKDLSEVADPQKQYYELSHEQSVFYDNIIQQYFCEDGDFKGAIYQPSVYEQAPKSKKDKQENQEYQQQKNLFGFMRRLLVKRFESSFGAFAKSIERFLKVHQMVKSFIDSSGVYILDRKLIESIYNTDEEAEDFATTAIVKALKIFVENAKKKTSPKHTKIYDVSKFKFRQKFLDDIDKDIALFELLQKKIATLDLLRKDTKRQAIVETIKKVLTNPKETAKRKVIVFTEYTDTVRHLQAYFSEQLKDRVLVCDGKISPTLAKALDSNFNAKYSKQEDRYDVLVTSDKLSEGFNLNRAGLIINYDIPWNLTRVIQRVGRINRIGTKVFDELHIYNFFPTEKGADIVQSEQIAAQKMFLIHHALGEDAKIFHADEEPSASGLFRKLNSNPDEADELSIQTIVRNEYKHIEKNYPEVIVKIQDLPNRTKTAKAFDKNNLLVLRKKGMALFSLLTQSDGHSIKTQEITFQELYEYVKCELEETRLDLLPHFWKAYQSTKKYKPRYRKKTSEMSLEQQAITALKALQKQGRIDKIKIPLKIVMFMTTLLRDLKQYKTLPKYTLRRLTLPKKSKNDYEQLLKNVTKLHQRIGSEYLNITLRQSGKVEEDVIIAVENRKA